MNVRDLFSETPSGLGFSLRREEVSEYFKIDGESRVITPPTDFENFGVESDENSKRVWFEAPRIVDDEIDLSTLNLYVNYQNANGEKDKYIVDDVEVVDDKIYFSWLISRKATRYKGTLTFIVCAIKTNSKGEIQTEWNTTLCTGQVLEGLEVENPEVPEAESDLINQLIDLVRTTSEKAVADVEAAKAEAIASIETAGSPIFANALKATASGSLLTLSDSAEAPLQSMKIYGKTKQFTTTGKNKLPYPYTNTTVTTNGITFTDNGDGTITCNGTAEETVFFRLRDLTDGFMVSAGEYTLSGCPSGGSNSTYHLYCVNKSQSAMLLNDAGNGATATLASDEIYGFYIKISNGQTVSNLTFKPMLRPVGTDNTWEPYTGGIPSPNPDYPQELVSVGDSGSTTEYVMGKNFAVYPYRDTTKTVNGLTWTDNGDGSISVSGTSEKVYSQFILNNSSNASKLIHNQTYKLVQSASSKVQILISYTDEKGNLVQSLTGVTWKKEYTFANLYLSIANANTTVNETIKPLLCLSTETDDTWEPYKEQSLTIPTPNGLPGIPVSSGGNYTDSNGQQYVCDEVDFERGVYVQRVNRVIAHNESGVLVNGKGNKYIAFNASPRRKASNDIAFSNKYRYKGSTADNLCVYGTQNSIVLVDNRFTDNATAKQILSSEKPEVMYILETPIETPLTEEEIQAYKALHTNYPNTTIYNSDGAGAEVEYVADTKNYIDNKFAALEAAILSTGGNV